VCGLITTTIPPLYGIKRLRMRMLKIALTGTHESLS
jgi:hypothetical protein